MISTTHILYFIFDRIKYARYKGIVKKMAIGSVPTIYQDPPGFSFRALSFNYSALYPNPDSCIVSNITLSLTSGLVQPKGTTSLRKKEERRYRFLLLFSIHDAELRQGPLTRSPSFWSKAFNTSSPSSALLLVSFLSHDNHSLLSFQACGGEDAPL